ncbi:XrtA/PEP-CTERM system-associated ATPase [Aurantiacibacter gilvus]|uniref:XrtA/PEP-CTERM system-associated ATPase n=1 Tax=Aurantiacibacter gilvus TaxID=3139141 RepID=A0ABU9ID74_9SPHN
MFDNFYGLTGKPFQLTPDPEFYFRSITHRKALSYLGYGLAQGEGFIVITGEVGAGKSTLVAHMMESLDTSAVTVAQIVTSKLDDEEVIHVVAGAFGIDIEGHDKATALTEIESFLHEEARDGRRCLLVLDEAQNLAVEALEELRMLSNFQLGNHPLLQTLLLGQPEFRTTLQADERLEQLRQRVIAAHHLEPMQKGEIEPYITHRLKIVGWDGNPSFDQRVFSELYEASGGIPRKINQIANRLMLLGAVEERSRIDAAMLQNVLSEMAAERAFPEAPPAPMPEPEKTFEPVKAMPTEPRIDKAMLEEYLAERDAQIVELQQAIVELSDVRDTVIAEAVAPEIETLRAQLARVEAKCFEQERTIRQTLTMLIDWIESEMDSSKAA